MGGGQAGAPADNDHVPWSRPPGVATVTLLVTARAGPGGPARISEPEGAEAQIRPEKPKGRGRGEAAEGCGAAEKNLRAAKLMMLRLNINDMSN
jgi:hypothetical protein